MSNSKLNVCLLNDSFPPVIDGVANVVCNYAKELTEKGVKVTVATPKYPGISNDYPFEILEYPSLNTVSTVGYVTGVPFSAKYVSQFVDRKIDILHTHCPMTSCMLSRIIRDNIDKPIIMTYHTKYDIDVARTIKSKGLQRLSIKAIVEDISACDEVWAVSDGAADNLRSLGYKGDIVIMRNGVDMPKGKSSPEEIKKIREEYGLKGDKPIFLFAGRMMWYKGIRIILDALKILKDHNFPYQMLFVGGGLEFNEIKEYSEKLGLDDVIFAGPVKDRNKLKQIFSSCDLFLFPSTFDTCALVVREAASSGLGSVLIKGSCSAEGTTDMKNAILIDENAKSLANTLMNGNVDLYHRIGEKAMDDLYLSWADATDIAYKRYEYVLEHYKPKKRSFKPNEELFRVVAHNSMLQHKLNELEEDALMSGKRDLERMRMENELIEEKLKNSMKRFPKLFK